MKRFLIIVVLLIVLSACKNEPPVEKGQDGIYQVKWVETNPPPNSDGPCYAFFSQKIRREYWLWVGWCLVQVIKSCKSPSQQTRGV